MLSVLFFLFVYLFSICLFLGGLKDPAAPTSLGFSEFIILSILNILFFAAFIFIEIKFFKMKINAQLIIVLLTVFLINIITILITPLDNAINYVYHGSQQSVLITITNEYKIEYIICFFLMLLNIYISINYMIYRVRFSKHFAWLCLIIITFALIAVIYSYIAEQLTYELFFQDIKEAIPLSVY